ncbi:MAG: hypothetical protein AB1503_11800 [Bacillota bacterium]|nr:hypothetical protein [Bacillota bacterium]
MAGLSKRLRYLFGTTRGLVLMATAWDALLVAVLSTLSGPLRDLGIAAALPLRLVEAEAVGRKIMLYHALAMPFAAAITYFILELVPTSPWHVRTVRTTITTGYMVSSLCGLAFAYLYRSWILHGLFVAGLTLVFYAGVVLAHGLWPARHPNTDPAYAHWGRISLERVAFFTVAVLTLGSAALGAGAAAYFGNGFEAFLAEDAIRAPHHTVAQLAIIGHLHIMLALIAVAIMLVVGRYVDFKGVLHAVAMPIAIVGSSIMALACWSVTVWEGAHTAIYVGASLVLPAALLLVIYAWTEVARGAPPGRRLAAAVGDPLRFGMLFQQIYVNFVVTFPGMYVAFNLDEYFRVIPAEYERRFLSGHWHVLATLCATIVLFLVADYLGQRGWIRRTLGWGVLLGADLAFAFAVVYMFGPPGVDMTWTWWFIDVGLGTFLIVLAVFLGWRLVDLFRPRGEWYLHLSQAGRAPQAAAALAPGAGAPAQAGSAPAPAAGTLTQAGSSPAPADRTVRAGGEADER